MKDEVNAVCISFILHPSSFILNSYALPHGLASAFFPLPLECRRPKRKLNMRHATLTRFVFALTLTLSASAVSRAQSEEWIHARPEWVVPQKLSVFTCDGVTGVKARWIFNERGWG